MSWNIKTPGDYINGPLTVAGDALFSSKLGVGAAATVAKLQSNGALCVSGAIQNLSTYPQANTFSADIFSNQVRLMALGPNNSTAGAFAFVLASANASVYSTPMTLDSVGLGLGAAPDCRFRVLDAAGNGVRIGFLSGSGNFNLFDAASHQFRPVNGVGTNFAEITANGLGVGRAPSASGVGIAFPSAQSASTDANTLDDYEEGTFTPTVGGTWTSSPTSLTGTYTKVGRLVTIQISFNGAASKSSAVAGWIDGLPFNVVATGTGSVSDNAVGNKGVCFAANSTRVWLTDTSFIAGANYLSLSYTV